MYDFNLTRYSLQLMYSLLLLLHFLLPFAPRVQLPRRLSLCRPLLQKRTSWTTTFLFCPRVSNDPITSWALLPLLHIVDIHLVDTGLKLSNRFRSIVAPLPHG